MSSANKHVAITPVARSIPYDDTVQSPLSGTSDVQAMLDYLKNMAAVSASPGFTYGRSGTLPVGTWLLNDTVPCNLSGRTVFLSDALIRKVFVAHQNAAIVKYAIYKHDGNSVNLTLVGTVTTGAQRSQTFDVSWTVEKDKQLAIRVATDSPNSGKESVVGLLISGMLT